MRTVCALDHSPLENSSHKVVHVVLGNHPVYKHIDLTVLAKDNNQVNCAFQAEVAKY